MKASDDKLSGKTDAQRADQEVAVLHLRVDVARKALCTISCMRECFGPGCQHCDDGSDHPPSAEALIADTALAEMFGLETPDADHE